jgi:outer membrane protein insertion porin family
MSARILRLCIFIFIVFTSIAYSQETDFENGKTYILGGVEVTGVKSYNKQTVVSFTGLRVGQPITIPGEEISTMINKLWGLGLFSDINLFVTKIEGDKAFLELNITELPTLSRAEVTGIRKRKIDEIIKDTDLKKGKKVNESFIANTKNYLLNKYKKQGYLNTKVTIVTAPDTVDTNTVKMLVNIDKGEKIKVSNITFEGNEKIKSKKLRKAMKNTKQKFPLRFWKKSKYIEEDYKEDLTSLIDTYKSRGYRDARVIADTVVNNENNTLNINIKVEEGNKYYFGSIDFVGNTAYTDEQLARVLGIKKGDTYNGVLLRERISNPEKPDGIDVTNTYQNNGYLFSNVNPVEVSVENDTINFEIRIIEGKETFINNVTVVGNERTNDNVIFRELRVRPGQRYSRSDLIRSIREIGALGFFDAEQIVPDMKNMNPNEGTLDVEFGVVEKGASQIELQGGYGGGGFIGTLGLSFNNFAIKDIFKKEAYQPLPMGDGQSLSLRLQGSRFYQTYSFSFREPWFGGKKPVSFSTSLSHTVQFLYDPISRNADKSRKFNITGITFGLAKRVKWPDDYFQVSHALGFQHYNLKNYNTNLFTFGDGFSNSLTYTLGIVRNSKAINPIYPTQGSQFSLTARLTPPFSLFNGIDYAALEDDPDYQLKDANGNFINANPDPNDPTTIHIGPTIDPGEETVADRSKIDQEKYKWLEFYKVKFSGDWYTQLAKDLVLRTNAEFGFLGAYNNDRGIVPFERFFVGGDGLGNYTLDGRENIQLRGYPNNSLSSQDGSTIYNKFSLELRYPLTLKPSASIYGLVFLEGGAAVDNFKDFNPFQLKRSAGVGLRIFMPAFGLLGIDFGYGFDPINGTGKANGWETHFIIGQQF